MDEICFYISNLLTYGTRPRLLKNTLSRCEILLLFKNKSQTRKTTLHDVICACACMRARATSRRCTFPLCHCLLRIAQHAMIHTRINKFITRLFKQCTLCRLQLTLSCYQARFQGGVEWKRAPTPKYL